MAKNYRVTASVLNIRALPGGEIIGTVNQGDFIVVPEIGTWLPIEMEDNTTGWVSIKFVTEAKPGEIPPAPKGITGKQIVAKAMTQSGDPYIFGTEVDLDNPNPEAFDCSELVQWTCHQLGVLPEMPDGAANQCDHCRDCNTLISIAEAVKTVGALLFRISSGGNHVVISRGDGTTIEAKGSAYGTGVFSIANREWTHAAKIPGVVYG